MTRLKIHNNGLNDNTGARSRFDAARGFLQLGVLLGLVTVGMLLPACGDDGIGDPCIPEAIPQFGFDPDESFAETSSVGCRTRVCIVQNYAGDPRYVQSDLEEVNTCPESGYPPGHEQPGENGATAGPRCQTAEETERKVFCTAQCQSNGDCPDDMFCAPIFRQTTGASAQPNNYCLRPVERCTAQSDCTEAGYVCAPIDGSGDSTEQFCQIPDGA